MDTNFTNLSHSNLSLYPLQMDTSGNFDDSSRIENARGGENSFHYSKSRSSTPTNRNFYDADEKLKKVSSNSFAVGARKYFDGDDDFMHLEEAVSFLKLPSQRHSPVLRNFNNISEKQSGLLNNALVEMTEKMASRQKVDDINRRHFFELQYAADRYKRLLETERGLKDLSALNGSKSFLSRLGGDDFFKDEDMKKRYERLCQQIAELEQNSRPPSLDKQDAATSAFISSGFLKNDAGTNGDAHHFSDVEKGRSAPLDFAGVDHFKLATRNHIRPFDAEASIFKRPYSKNDGISNGVTMAKPAIQDRLNLSALSSDEMMKALDVDPSIRSSASVDSLNVSLDQRTKLQELHERLKMETACSRCGLDKNSRCVCDRIFDLNSPLGMNVLPQREELKLDDSGFNDMNKGKAVANFGNVARATQTDETDQRKFFTTNMVNNVDYASDSAANNGPKSHHRAVRKNSGARTGERQPRPFVAGKATGRSHSLSVNFQQLLASLKTHNIPLHNVCKRYGDGLSLTELVGLLQQELNRILAERKTQLKIKLREYDEITEEFKNSKDVKQRDSIAFRQKRLGQAIELRDTEVLRCQQQLELLEKVKTEASTGADRLRACGESASHQNVPTANNVRRFAKPTKSAALKIASKFHRAHSAPRVSKRQVLKDVQTMVTALNN